MVCICNFIEEILELDNEYAENVICLSVLENILDDNKKIAYFKRFAKEKTIAYIEKMIGK